MEKKMTGLVKAGVVLAFGLCASNAFAVDACNEAGGHSGSGTKTQGQNNSSVTGNIGSSGYHYEIWYQGGNNSMTYYDDGTFSAEWNGSNDFLARVGFKYNSTKTHDQIGYFTADYKFTKSGNASYSYIGIYGWTEDPLVEYYIVDDWFSKPSPQYLGDKKGEITVDGDTYDIYTYTRVQQPSIKGTSTFPQFFSVRRNARQCGHIDITAHFKKWDEVGLKMGKLYEVKVLAEAGGGATGKIDFTYFKMSSNGSASDGESSSAAATTPSTTTTPAPTDGGATGGATGGVTGGVTGGATGGATGGMDFGNMDFGNMDWGNMDFGDMDFGNMDWGNMDFGNMDFGNMGGTGDGTGTDWGNFDWGNAAGGQTGGVTTTPTTTPTVTPVTTPTAGTESEGPLFVGTNFKMAPSSKAFRVFNTKGRYLGNVELNAGSTLSEAIFAKFGKAGIYLVKKGAKTLSVKVVR